MKMCNFKEIGTAFEKFSTSVLNECSYAVNLLLKRKPQSLGEGLKRVKYSMKGVGESQVTKPGERLYKTIDGSSLTIGMNNIVNKKTNQGIGTVLNVSRPKLNPLKDGTYRIAKVRINPRCFWPNDKAISYVTTVKLRDGYSEILNQKTKVCDNLTNVFGKYCRDDARNLPLTYGFDAFYNAIPKIKYPERTGYTRLWSPFIR